MIKSRKSKLSESLKNRRSTKNEKFKPTDNLSPSEVAAVVSDWTRRSFADSWKTELANGEDFQGEIKDTLAPMQIWVDKKERFIQICYLSLDKADIDELVQIGLDSRLEADEAFIEDVCTAMRESFDIDHAVNYKELSMPVTQIELEEALDECESKALASYNRLESAFYNAVEGKLESRRTESKKNSRRVCESAISEMDGDVRQWAVDHIIDRLDEMEGMEVELSDLAHELVDRENRDGGVFYNNHQAWEWVSNHRYDAGDVLAMMCEEWGTCSPNPLIDPDAFCVVFLEEAIADVLDDSATVQEGGRVELTREVIDAIVEEIKE